MKRNIAKKFISLTLIFAFIVTPLIVFDNNSAIAAKATTIEQDKSSIKKKQNEMSTYKNKIAQLDKEIKDLKNSATSQLSLKNKYDEQIKYIEETIDLSEQLILDSSDKIVENEAKIKELQESYDKSYKLFIEMIRFSCEENNVNYIELILDSDSFSDFLSRVDIISDMLEYTKNIISNLENDKNLLSETKDAYDIVKNQNIEYKQILEDKTKEISVKRSEAEATIKNLEKDMEKARREYDAAEKEMNSVQDEIARITREMQSKVNAQKYVGGTFLWPVDPSYNQITSSFGMRLHPILKVNRMHNGIDIGVPYGAYLYAVNDGTVIMATYNGSLGNYVVIDHGGGLTTLYAHNSKLLVSVGQKVKRGDKIAKAGSTGLSTGVHCHFEVSVNGVRKNPLGYVTQPKK